MHPDKLLHAALLATLTALTAGCGGCQPEKVPEPTESARPPPPAATTASPTEVRERGVGLQPELCSLAARRFNELNGREPFDKKATNVIAFCLHYGNLAWYRCVTEATTPDGAKECMRLLGHAE